MRILVVHPRMSVFGGGERVAVHSIITALKAQNEVLLASEVFDIPAFEDFFACQGLFKQVRLLTYPSFRPIADRAVLYQRLLYHQWRIRGVVTRAKEFDLILSTQDVAYLPSATVPIPVMESLLLACHSVLPESDQGYRLPAVHLQFHTGFR